jgi:hypothetical protein
MFGCNTLHVTNLPVTCCVSLQQRAKTISQRQESPFKSGALALMGDGLATCT